MALPAEAPPPVAPPAPRSGNYAVFRARDRARTYLVVSRSLGEERPSREAFHDEESLDPLAEDLAALAAAGQGRAPMSLRTNGFNTHLLGFEEAVLDESKSGAETLRPEERIYVGFRWPSQGITPRTLLGDLLALVTSPGIGLQLVLLPALALIFRPWLLARLAGTGGWPWAAKLLAAPYLEPCLAAAMLGGGLLMLGLRLSTYPRDRYRALHYGVPDLGEFMRDLERRLIPRGVRVRLDVIGHSMGCLTLINAFRVMSDYFHETGGEENTLGRERTYELRALILCAPDLPATMATPERNNYFLSALRRFEGVHVFSSDRDIVLKWASSFGNWFSEPEEKMAGRRLGNVILVRGTPPRLGHPDSRCGWAYAPVNRPVMRNYHLYGRDPVRGQGAPAAVWFHDCTLTPSVGGWVAAQGLVLIPIVALLGAIAGRVDQPVLRWLFVIATLYPGLGLVGSMFWAWARDRRGLGPVFGYFADWPAITIVALGWSRWNPHSGYFLSGDSPRRKIAALLRDLPDGVGAAERPQD